MYGKYICSIAITLMLALPVSAQETSENEDITFSSGAKIQQEKLIMKNKAMTDINRMIYDESNKNRMKEYVRNSNAIKKIMGEPTTEVDVQDKKALSKYMEEELGLDDIVKVSEDQEQDENKVYRSKAAELLK